MMILSVFFTIVFRIVASVLEHPAASIFMLEDLGAFSTQDIKCYSVKKRIIWMIIAYFTGNIKRINHNFNSADGLSEDFVIYPESQLEFSERSVVLFNVRWSGIYDYHCILNG
jgi:hypothetical protein